MPDLVWSKVADVGIAAIALFAVGWGLFRAARWSGEHLILPLRDAGIDHLNRVGTHLDQQGELLERNTAALTSLQASSQEQTTLLRQLNTNLENGRAPA